ncbi:MAG TPA: sialate O-acetylesterase, partial [Paludibacter sp.]|nr:sialate O-acetylesterase [Paludibacter sp.]
DKKFVPAKAEIANNQIIVTAQGIDSPVAVRYSWSNWSEGNLTNVEGFPATPFRTDTFDLITTGVKAPKY